MIKKVLTFKSAGNILRSICRLTQHLPLGAAFFVPFLAAPLFSQPYYVMDTSRTPPMWSPLPITPPNTPGITLVSTDPFSGKITTIGRRDTLNVLAGRGIVPALSDDGKQLTLQFAIDTATLPPGAPGPAGPTGATGAQGPPGPAGAGASLPPGTNIGDVLTWDGAKWIASFNQGIPLFTDGVRNADGSYACNVSPELLQSNPNWRIDGWGIRVYNNGLRQKSADFQFPPPVSATGATIRFVQTPAAGADIICDYRVKVQ